MRCKAKRNLPKQLNKSPCPWNITTIFHKVVLAQEFREARWWVECLWQEHQVLYVRFPLWSWNKIPISHYIPSSLVKSLCQNHLMRYSRLIPLLWTFVFVPRMPFLKNALYYLFHFHVKGFQLIQSEWKPGMSRRSNWNHMSIQSIHNSPNELWTEWIAMWGELGSEW